LYLKTRSIPLGVLCVFLLPKMLLERKKRNEKRYSWLWLNVKEQSHRYMVTFRSMRTTI
jgi:hypothetical protein